MHFGGEWRSAAKQKCAPMKAKTKYDEVFISTVSILYRSLERVNQALYARRFFV
jgi:hypothetical protein